MKPAKLARAALIVALAAGLALAFANRDAFSQEALQQWLATRAGGRRSPSSRCMPRAPCCSCPDRC
jgi:hypothetical protein